MNLELFNHLYFFEYFHYCLIEIFIIILVNFIFIIILVNFIYLIQLKYLIIIFTQL